MENLPAMLEAALFAAGDSVSVKDIADALDIPPGEVEEAAARLQTQLTLGGRGIRLLRLDDRLQLCSFEEYTPFVERLLTPIRKRKLSQSLLETLAIVAYKQPVTRLEIEQVRGVRCEKALQTLRSLELIREAGRKETIGNPILYATTEEFLRHFALPSLDALPPLPKAEGETADPWDVKET